MRTGDVSPAGWRFPSLPVSAESGLVSCPTSQRVPVFLVLEWCLPCKEMEVNVFARPEVAAALSDVVLLKVDLTREGDDETLPALKKKYGVETLPAVRLVSSEGRVIGSINELMEAPAFLSSLRAAGL